MDRRDDMALHGSASFYMQRGMTGSGSGTQPSLHGNSGIHSLSNPNIQFQSNIGGFTIGSTLPVEPSSAFSAHGDNVGSPAVVPQTEPVKRKRGRPRKYGAEGSVSLALSPAMSSHPGTITPTQKRRGRPPGTGRKQQVSSLFKNSPTEKRRGRPPGARRKQPLSSPGACLSFSAGMGFTPHIITVAVGEDIATKLLSFSQRGSRAICVLSANGAVSTATLRQPSTSGGTVTYEGCFEILCLSGFYLLINNSGSHKRSGGLSISLASPDGRVIGGGVGGILIAAKNVQVIVGSFIWGGTKMKNKIGEASEVVRDLEHKTAETPVTQTSDPPSQNFHTQTSSVGGIWPGSRQMDMRDAHVDIDLMRGCHDNLLC